MLAAMTSWIPLTKQAMIALTSRNALASPKVTGLKVTAMAAAAAVGAVADGVVVKSEAVKVGAATATEARANIRPAMTVRLLVLRTAKVQRTNPTLAPLRATTCPNIAWPAIAALRARTGIRRAHRSVRVQNAFGTFRSASLLPSQLQRQRGHQFRQLSSRTILSRHLLQSRKRSLYGGATRQILPSRA